MYLVRIQRASRSGQSCCTIHCCSCCDRTERVLFSLRMERVRSSPACPCSSIHKTNAKSKVYRLTTRVHRGGGQEQQQQRQLMLLLLLRFYVRPKWSRPTKVCTSGCANLPCALNARHEHGVKGVSALGEENRGNTEIYPVLACRC